MAKKMVQLERRLEVVWRPEEGESLVLLHGNTVEARDRTMGGKAHCSVSVFCMWLSGFPNTIIEKTVLSPLYIILGSFVISLTLLNFPRLHLFVI